MSGTKTMGISALKSQFVTEHCELIHTLFDKNGDYIAPQYRLDVRERFHHCYSLMESNDSANIELANKIIAKTPASDNCLGLATAAMDLLMVYKDNLTPENVDHLKNLIRAHWLNLFEFRHGSPGTNNFSTILVYSLLAAGEILDSYDFPHEFALIPEVYSQERLRVIGRNSLQSLVYASQHQKIFDEWNCPGYTASSLSAMARIVELIPDKRIKKMALKIETKLWKETLSMFHPELGLLCGPYGRAYRHDILGHYTPMAGVMAYLGLSRYNTIVGWFEEYRKDPKAYFELNRYPYMWSNLAYQIFTPFHLPEKELEEFKNRVYPKEFKAPFRWDPFGKLKPETNEILSVQGDYFPGGKSKFTQLQEKNYALGFRKLTPRKEQSFPWHFHYALKPEVKSFCDVRNVTGGVMFSGKPIEWTVDANNQQTEYNNFNHHGIVKVIRRDDGLDFSGHVNSDLKDLSTEEVSVNTFIPIHFSTPEKITLNKKVYSGKDISIKDTKGVCHIEDNGFIYEIIYEFNEKCEIKLFKWANFIRFAAFFYKGKSKKLKPKELDKINFKGSFKIKKVNK
jgi:hypothetical protein